jgi:probable rRNA maturation factor
VQALGNAIVLEVGHPLAKEQGRRLEARALQFMGKLGLAKSELSLSIVTDRAIRRLNRTWRRKDKPTDVLSFPAGEMPETGAPKLLGDVVISLDTAKRQARTFRRPLDEELDRYLAHGILHLLGHDHEKRAEAKRMAALEEALLGRSGMVGDARALGGLTLGRQPNVALPHGLPDRDRIRDAPVRGRVVHARGARAQDPDPARGG